MAQLHFVERHQEFDAVDYKADDKLEPHEQGKQPEKRSVGNAHAGDECHAPAVNACSGQPEEGDEESGDKCLPEGGRIGMRGKDIEAGEPYYQNDERQEYP